jgi:hypothetical protein
MEINGAKIDGSMSMEGNMTWTNLTVEGDGFSYQQEQGMSSDMMNGE